MNGLYIYMAMIVIESKTSKFIRFILPLPNCKFTASLQKNIRGNFFLQY